MLKLLDYKLPRNNRQPSKSEKIYRQPSKLPPHWDPPAYVVTRASQEKFLKKRDSSQSKFQHSFWEVAIWNMVYLLSQTSQTVEVKLLSTVDNVKNHSRHAWPEGRYILYGLSYSAFSFPTQKPSANQSRISSNRGWDQRSAKRASSQERGWVGGFQFPYPYPRSLHLPPKDRWRATSWRTLAVTTKEALSRRSTAISIIRMSADDANFCERKIKPQPKSRQPRSQGFSPGNKVKKSTKSKPDPGWHL